MGGLIQAGLTILNGPDGSMLDYFGQAESVEITDGDHGHESLTATIPMTEESAFRWYARTGVLWAVLSALGHIVFEGRIEDVAIVAGGVQFVALGPWRSLSDRPYTALWSKSSTAGWRPATSLDFSAYEPARWEIDNNNRLYIAPRKNETYPTGVANDVGTLTYAAPHNGERNITVCQFAWQFFAPTDWIIRLMRAQDDFSSRAVVSTIATGNGALQTGAFFATFSGSPRLIFEFFNNTGGNATITQDTGTNYFRATAVRLATATTNKVDTTLGTTIAAGTRTVTPGSMANIYVGQELVIGGTVSEMVTVTAVTATTFTAVFAQAHNNTDTVKAIVVYADEVVKEIVSKTNGLNSDQLRNVTGLIQSPGVDLLDIIYEDAEAGSVVSELAARGDTSGRQYEAGVWRDREMHFRPRYSVSRTWQVDALNVEVSRTLDTMRNQMYATYQEAGLRRKRTSSTTPGSGNSLGVDRPVGLQRRGFIDVQTTSLTQAERERDNRLNDTAIITPRVMFDVEALYDENNQGPYPLWMARAGDMVILRNLPPALGAAVDRLRRFRIKHKRYLVHENTLELTPELAPPELAVMVGELASAGGVRR